MPSKAEEAGDANVDPFLIEFAADDPGNPINWPRGKKWAVTDVMSATGFNRIMVSTIMAPALPTIGAELGMNSVETSMSLSIYLLATAVGPLVLAPLTEMYGRKPVLHASNVWFFAFNIACGFAKTKGALLAARFLAGFGASAIYGLSGGVLSDIWRPEERGRSLSMYLLIPLLGAAVGPIIGGFIASRTDWRWAFWATSAFQGAMTIASAFIFRETFAPAILRQRAARMRRMTNDPRYYAAVERLERGKTTARLMARALSRPLRLLATHPIIQVTTVISALGYGLLYIMLSTYATLWIEHYGMDPQLSGLHYLAVAGGEILGSQISGPIMDWQYRRASKRLGGLPPKPEARVPLMSWSLIGVPAGLLIYGWAAEYRKSWVVVDLGVVIVTCAAQISGLPAQAYVMDVYPEHTSSAIGARQFLSSLVAFLFPLFAPAMYSALGYGWGNSVIAFVYLCLVVPAPWIIYFYGEKLRAKVQSSA